MYWVILSLIFIISIFFIVRQLVNTEPKKVIQLMKWLLVLFFVLGLIFFGLRFSSFFLWLILPILYFSLRTLLGIVISRFAANYFNSKSNFINNPNNSSNSSNISSIETEYIIMSLSQIDGNVSGVVKKGKFSGDKLEDLSLESLFELRKELKSDKESLDLLEAYLDRVASSDWRDQAENLSSTESYSTIMTIKEAYLMLGLDESATKDEIKEAHHKLMLKIHPDQGGSNFLASKINQAKELLLKNF
ncbi:MAG: hypothetical protein CMM18_03890 [Rhodospirillaceae bacterium]|nr:hypothetical protein [Rhodospirillaceae bacterium]